MSAQVLVDQGLLGSGPFMAVSAMLVLAVALKLGARRRRAARDPRHAVARTALDGMLLLALAGVVAATLVPTHLGGPAARDAVANVNFTPLQTITSILRWGSPAQQFDNLVLNVLLFVPFGWAMALKARTRLPVLVASATGALLSVSVEAGQFLLPLGRSTDVDDLLLNTAGAAIGAIGAVAVLPALRWMAHSHRRSTATA